MTIKMLEEVFTQQFKVNHLMLDFIHYMKEKHCIQNTINDFIIEQFNKNFTYGELYDLFKTMLNDEDLKTWLENMGHNYVNLDCLDEKEKNNFY